jgi:hypothetical protein
MDNSKSAAGAGGNGGDFKVPEKRASDEGCVVCTHCDMIVGYASYENRASVWAEMLAHERHCPKNPLAIELAEIARGFGNVSALDGLTLAEKAAKCVRMLAALNAPAELPRSPASLDARPSEKSNVLQALEASQGGYTGDPCVNCGRIRVDARTLTCEKCEVHQCSEAISMRDAVACISGVLQELRVPAQPHRFNTSFEQAAYFLRKCNAAMLNTPAPPDARPSNG